METLRKYEGEKVEIIDTDGKIWRGFATDWIAADDNAPVEIESLIIDGWLELTKADIASIKIIK